MRHRHFWLRGMSVLLGCMLSAAVSAHAMLVKAVPAQDAVLDASPAAVSLWFNEPLEIAFSTVTLSDSAARVVAQGELRGLDDNGLALAITTPLPAGAYTLHYRVLSVDGHIVEDELRFVIDAVGP